MNLEESDSYRDEIEKNTRSRKGVMLSIVLCAMLIALLFIMIIILKHKDAITLKMYLDDNQISIPSDLSIVVDDKVYINVKTMGSMLGYTYTKGVYGAYNENPDSCYLQNNAEIIAITGNENKYTKYIEITNELTIADLKVTAKNENGYSETFKMDDTILYDEESGNLYVSLENITNMFNMKYNWQEYRIYFYSMDYIVRNAQNIVGQLGYTEMSGYYENMKANIYGYAVVKKGDTDSSYGVISLNDGKEILSTKYQDIVYVQNADEFYIKAANGTVGIVNNEGGTVIPLSEYDEIVLVYDDNDERYYRVKDGKEYGIINKNGKIIFYPEYKEIGLSDVSEFKLVDIDNTTVILGKCIPVLLNGKYGLYTTEGDPVLDCVYDGFGYIAYNSTSSENTSSSNLEQSVLIIPASEGINGLIVNYNDKYGIYDIDKKELITPTSFDKIYAITKSGETTYYLEYNEEKIELRIYLEENDLVTIKDTDEDEKDIDEEDDEIDSENDSDTEDTNSTKVPVDEE